ncbi:hypothetical protein, partial [Staphylococcus pseudintermedius]|uniref:hypothetical protein n=1 Tax=Staphylococcus pseudintermedius TaxID=283734 RepID=UPI001CA31DC7
YMRKHINLLRLYEKTVIYVASLLNIYCHQRGPIIFGTLTVSSNSEKRGSPLSCAFNQVVSLLNLKGTCM